MNTIHKLALLVAAIVAALAMSTSSAFGQTVEVLDEATTQHCGDVTVDANHVVEGGCEIHATSTGTANLHVHLSGVGEILFSQCNNEFVGHLNEEGLGFITGQQLAGEQCGIEPCDEATHEQLEWPILGWEGGGGNEALATTFCVRDAQATEGTGNGYCSVAVDLTQSGHEQTFTAVEQSCVESTVELSGTWVTDDSLDEAEIVHTHPGS